MFPKRRLARLAAALLFWTVLWAVAAMLTGRALLLPGPAEVFRRLLELGAAPAFWHAAFFTLLRVFGGFCAGVLAGALLASAASASRAAEVLISPAVRVLRATPVASFILLLLLWARADWVPLLVAALMALPVVWENVMRGIAEMDRGLLEAARVYRFTRGKILRICYLPSLRPYFASGCLTAMGLAWKSGVAAEVLCLPRAAVGTQIYFTKLYLETPSLFAWTLVVVILSLLIEGGLRALLLRGKEAAA